MIFKKHGPKSFIIGGAIAFLLMSCSSPSEHYDVLIKNTTIVDGTGKAAFTGSVAINGEKIAAVGMIKATANLEIDGAGLITCPGFVDSHSHPDQTILQYPLESMKNHIPSAQSIYDKSMFLI